MSPGQIGFLKSPKISAHKNQPASQGVFACHLISSVQIDASKGNRSEEVEFSDKFDKLFL
ncbi:hypothetical protein B0E33_03750 [Roseibium algicola]|uniref:Uncharacterized protein n=1 Tax=Roseibium algicola TaxID=2857014 RepID=A0ABM6HXM5_9HYPH|nr:hypothetical protein B0E33_03750 [Roseibium aggregatum]